MGFVVKGARQKHAGLVFGLLLLLAHRPDNQSPVHGSIILYIARNLVWHGIGS